MRTLPAQPAVVPNWTILTNHAHVLVCISMDPTVRLAEVARSGAPVSYDELAAFTRERIQEHGAHWRKNASDPGQDRALTREVIERLVALSLARREGDQIFPLPAVGRYALSSNEAGPDGQLSLF